MSEPHANRVRPPLNDDALRKFCELPTINGYVSDRAQLRLDVEGVIDDHWFLDTVTKAVPWPSLMERSAAMWAASDEVQAAQDRLKALLNVSLEAEPCLLEVHARRLAAARRKLDSARQRVAQAFSFIDKIEPKEQSRVMDAVISAVIDGFGKQTQILKGVSSGALTPPSLIPKELRDPLKTAMHRALERLQRKANLSERIGAIALNAQSDHLCDRVLKKYGLAIGRIPPRDAGRPGGTKKYLECRFFVRDLLAVVTAAGGDLTVDKNHENGTLIEALRLFAPYLLSLSTRDLKSCRHGELPRGLASLLAEIRTDWLAGKVTG